MQTIKSAATLLLAAALMGLGRACVVMPLLSFGQALMLFGARRASLRMLVMVSGATVFVASSLVFAGSADILFGSVARYLTVIAIGTTLYVLSLVLDRWAVPRLPTCAAALVFPAVRAPMEVAGALGGPNGVWGSFAAPAAGMWPISGLVALGGFSLLSFVLLWLASAVALFWQEAAAGRRRSAWVSLLPAASAVLAINLVLAIGAPARAPASVRVGAVTTPELFSDYLPSWLGDYGKGRLSAQQVASVRPALFQTVNASLMRAEAAADQGAKIVYTGEGDVKVLAPDMPQVEASAGDLARRRRIWLGLGVHEFRENVRPLVNEILLFSPDGKKVSTYEKVHPVGAEVKTMAVSERAPQPHTTIWGKITGLICYDTEFLAYTRMIGRQGADILFAPSSDWRAIARIRGAITRFRSIETGMALVRPTHGGLSEIVAPNGRLIASADYDARNGVVLVGDVPTKARVTTYAQAGDWPGGAALALLVILCTVAMRRRVLSD